MSFIQVDNVVFRVLVHEQTNYMAADETNTTGDNYIFHCLIIFQVRNTFLSDSVQYGTLMPKVSLILVLSRTEYEERVTSEGNSLEWQG